MEQTLRPRRDFAALEVRRLQAARLFAQGHPQAEVVRRFRVSRPTAHRWFQAWRRGGAAALKGTARAGRKPRLSLAGRHQLAADLLRGPRAWGFRTELWTLERIAQVIRKVAHVRYSLSQTWRVLQQLGWSRQRPARRAQERDEPAIARWVRRRWPQVKKTPKG
jgi:transposase